MITQSPARELIRKGASYSSQKQRFIYMWKQIAMWLGGIGVLSVLGISGYLFADPQQSTISQDQVTHGVRRPLQSPKGQSLLAQPSSQATTTAVDQIWILTANPPIVFAGTPTVVTITTDLTDLRIIPSSVNLQQVDASGTPLSIVGTMTRDPVRQTFYSMQLTLNVPLPQILYYRLSAGLIGTVLRQYSRPLSLAVTSVQVASWLTYTTHNGYHFLYPANWIVFEADDGSLRISPPDAAQIEPMEGAANITVTYERNPSNLSVPQFFNGQFGPDLYTDTSSISTVTIASILSTRFGGLSMVPSDEVIVIPVNAAFIVIYASAPDDIMNAFLASISVP